MALALLLAGCGADCPVLVERVVDRPVPEHLKVLVSCDPQQAGAPC